MIFIIYLLIVFINLIIVYLNWKDYTILVFKCKSKGENGNYKWKYTTATTKANYITNN